MHTRKLPSCCQQILAMYDSNCQHVQVLSQNLRIFHWSNYLLITLSLKVIQQTKGSSALSDLGFRANSTTTRTRDRFHYTTSARLLEDDLGSVSTSRKSPSLQSLSFCYLSLGALTMNLEYHLVYVFMSYFV